MEYLTIEGRQKTSIKDLKNALFQLLNYEPTITTKNYIFKCFIIIYSNSYNVIDILRILVKHCSIFRVVVDEEIDYETFLSVYYYWDGKNLIRCYKDYFGSTCENVNFLLD